MKRILVATLAAALLAPASAHAIPDRYWTQAPNNAAGVTYHPSFDFFEIWDNVRDGQAVKVKWNYMGIKDRWKTIKSHGHYDTYSAHIADYPHYIYFRIYGHDTDGLLVRSEIVRWRTWGDG